MTGYKSVIMALPYKMNKKSQLIDQARVDKIMCESIKSIFFSSGFESDENLDVIHWIVIASGQEIVFDQK